MRIVTSDCINTCFSRYHWACINENKSRVLIREFACTCAVNARFLFMLVTRHHAKHVGNYEYLTSARIKHIFRVGKCDDVVGEPEIQKLEKSGRKVAEF